MIYFLYKFYNKEELNLEYLMKIPNDMDDYVKDAIHNIKNGKKKIIKYNNIIYG